VFRIFIDEVGNADLGSASNDNERYLSLTGVIVELNYHNGPLTQELSAVKVDVFGSHAITLHRRELRRKEDPFTALRDDAIKARFDHQVLRLFADLQYRVITVIIDKREHLDRYKVWRFHPYHYCLTVMLERYVMHLSDLGSTGDVMVETRQKADNEKLAAAYRYFYDHGSDWIDSSRAQRILTTRELKIRAKDTNIAGLQIADLLAHPSFRAYQSEHLNVPMTAPFGSKVAEILRNGKYLRSSAGLIRGWGCKWLP